MHESQQHALAGAVRPHDHGDAAIRDGQIEIVDDPLAAGDEGELAQFEGQDRTRAVERRA
jgi:hypothetical protein